MTVDADQSVYTEDIGPTSDVPRKKCCEGCAFRKSDPQGLQADVEFPLLQDDWASGWATFYCVHTTDEQDRHPVCAGFNALYGKMSK